ncbi:MAG: DNA polymerase III subunit alpha [Acidobacteriota bacterium]
MTRQGSFVHLHNHSPFSLLDGACRIDEMIEKAIGFNMGAVAITDHGNMFGVIKFYKKAMEKGIKPIIGCEAYIAPGSRFDKSPNQASLGKKPYFHLTILVENHAGYKNLIKLVSAGFLEGFYYRPRMDKELLAEHSEGLIAMSGCLAGEIPMLLASRQLEKACRVAGEYREIFGEPRFFLEIQDQSVPDQKIVNPLLLEVSKKTKIPLVATNDCHFLNADDYFAHDVLICIQTGTNIKSRDRLKYTEQHYFKSPDEMRMLFKWIPEAVENSLMIAEKCNLLMDQSGYHLPEFKIPEGYTVEQYFIEMVHRGFQERMNELQKKGAAAPLRFSRGEYKKRLDNEIQMILNMKFPGYFLIVWDFIKFARENKIPVGPGRGSAAGSLVAYCLRITDIDPLQYGLLFERFLNPERITLPDIDIDFCFKGRSKVIEYVMEKYGRENVAQIITFGTMAARGVIRDVGRGLDIPYADVDRIAKMIPPELDATIDSSLATVPQLKDVYKRDSVIRELIDVARKLEGLTRHASTHAAGVVIAPRSITEYTPLYKTTNEETTTQYAKDEIEEIGLLKMDFLGLKTLTLIDDVVRMVQEDLGERIIPEEFHLDDSTTYELFSRAQTSGVFQFESSGMQDILRKLKPSRFEDLIAMNALYRPGPIKSGMIDDFIRGRHGKRKFETENQQLKEILDETYGVIVYQEQVMKIASALGNFSMGEADILRRAMGKKKMSEMKAQRDRFVGGARKRRVSTDEAERIFDLMENFAGYGFNKSHSAAYALIAYRTAFLKAHYPVHFMAALLTSEKENTGKIAKYINECREMGIKILPPDINSSDLDFTVEGNSIRFGLAAIKNVGEGAITSILEARKRVSRFDSIFQFCSEVDLRLANKRVLESLIKSGSFDSLGVRRAQLFSVMDSAIECAQKTSAERESGQKSLFAAAGLGSVKWKQPLPEIEEWKDNVLLSYEKETLGFYITGHPLNDYLQELRDFCTHTTSSLMEVGNAQEVTLGGIVTALRRRKTKKGDMMAAFTLEDLQGFVEVVVLPEKYKRYQGILENDLPVFLRGTVEAEEEKIKILLEQIYPLSEVREKQAESVLIKVMTTGTDEEIVSKLNTIFELYRGNCSASFLLIYPQHYQIHLKASPNFLVSPSKDFISEVEELLGKGSVKIRIKGSSTNSRT